MTYDEVNVNERDKNTNVLISKKGFCVVWFAFPFNSLHRTLPVALTICLYFLISIGNLLTGFKTFVKRLIDFRCRLFSSIQV